MNGPEITIENVWLKNLGNCWWKRHISNKSTRKKQVIYNLRPINWYSERSTFKSFDSKENFLKALNETRYQYSKTHHDNSHWLKKVLKNYTEHTGISLKVA